MTNIFERFGTLYPILDIQMVGKIVKKIQKKELSHTTEGNFSKIYIYDLTALLRGKQLVVIKSTKPGNDLYKEYLVQKSIYRALNPKGVEKNEQENIPEPYVFMETTNPFSNDEDEKYLFMEYIDGKTYYRHMQEEYLRILGVNVPKHIHQFDDIAIDHILKDYIGDFKPDAYIQQKNGLLTKALGHKKSLKSGYFLSKTQQALNGLSRLLPRFHEAGIGHNDLHQNPRNLILNAHTRVIDFGLSTQHSGPFTSNDSLILKDLQKLLEQ